MSLAVRQHLVCAAAAHRVLAAGRRARPPRRVGRPLRRALAAVVVVGLILAQGTVARAFLGLDPAGWLVVTQMSALVSQMTAIKRQVENYRDQTRAHVYGKIAPIDGKLLPLDNLLSSAQDPARIPWLVPLGQTPIEPEPVNQPFEDCAAVAPGTPCMPASADTLVPDATRDAIVDQALNASREVFGTTLPAHILDGATRFRDNLDYHIDLVTSRREVSDNQRAQYRATLELSASVLEEWRGCNESTTASPYTVATVARPPCVTRGGEGRGESLSDGQSGTEGMVETLAASVEYVLANQEGDASLTQLASIMAQVNLMRGRLQAAELELDIAEAEQAQRRQLQAEAARRLQDQLYVLRLECVQGNNGGTMYNMFVPDYETPADSDCVCVFRLILNTDSGGR